VRAEEVCGEEQLILHQVSSHCVRPVHPRDMDESQAPVARLSVSPSCMARIRSAGINRCVIRFSLPFGLARSCACGYFSARSAGRGVILFGVQGKDVVELFHAFQAVHEHLHRFGSVASTRTVFSLPRIR